MNTRADTSQRWTPSDDAIVRELAATTPVAEIWLDLSWRTLDAISSRIRTLGLRGVRHGWTAKEELALRFSWGADLGYLADRFGRTIHAIYDKAKLLGLTLGCPEGFESFNHAAKRTGYLRSQLQTILVWAGHKRHRRVTYDRCQRHQWIVDSFDVDEAVERWTEHVRTTETIKEAAVRLGTNHHRVREALITSGLELPPRPRRGCHWRIHTKTINEAMLRRYDNRNGGRDR